MLILMLDAPTLLIYPLLYQIWPCMGTNLYMVSGSYTAVPLATSSSDLWYRDSWRNWHLHIWSAHQKDGSHRWKRAGSKCGGNGAQLSWWRSCGQSNVPIMVQSLKKADRSHKIHFSLLETTAVSKPINLGVKYQLWTTDSKIWTLLTSSTRHQYKNSIYNNCSIRS